MPSSAGRGYQITVALIGVVALLVCFVRLGDTTAFRPDDESYHVEIAHEMYVTGSWWVPTWFDRPALNKPPLTYWLFAAGFAVQDVSFGAARVPMALLAIATAIVTMLCGRLMYGVQGGLIAGLLTITSFGIIAMGRVGMTDMPLCALMTAAVYACAKALATRRPGWWALLFAAAGASTLAKGPFSLIVIGMFAGFVVFCVRPRGLPALRHPVALGGLILGLALVIAWPFALWRNGLFREWYEFFVWRENLGKFNDQYYPPWVLGEYLLLYALPWSTLVMAAAWTQLRSGRLREVGVSVPLAWLAAVLVFHAIPATKLPHYVLPAVPACALLIASAWERLRDSTAGRLGILGVQIVLGLAAAALIAGLRLIPGGFDHVLVVSAAAALATAIWLLARTRDLIGAGLAYGVAFSILLAVVPNLAFPRLPAAALPHLRGHDVVLVKQQVWVYSYDIGQPTRQITTRTEYEEALDRKARVIVSDTDLELFVNEGADPRGFEEAFSWPQWKQTLEPAALVRAAWRGSRDELIERVRIVRRASADAR